MDAIEFTAQFKLLIENIRLLSLEDQQDKIGDFFWVAREFLSAILEAVASHDEILEYARSDFMDGFWKIYLDDQLIPLGLGAEEALRSQAGIKDFDMIMGFYCYSLWWACQSDESATTEEMLTILKKGVSFHSFHATKELIEYYMRTDLVKYSDEIEKLLEEVKVHGTPGYILLGKCYREFYRNTGKYDERYKSVLYFYTACELENYSENVIHNSCFGKRERGYSGTEGSIFQMVDQLCQGVGIDDFMKFRIKRESKQEAEIYLDKYVPSALSSFSMRL